MKRDFDDALEHQYDEGQYDTLAGRFLHGLRQFRRPAHGLRQCGDLRAVLFRSRHDRQRQQVAERVNSGVNFAALAPLGA